jgi:imidazolonepropionase-like amidohydrolase
MREELIVRNVTLLDGTGGGPRTNVDVAIANGAFAAIRPTDKTENGATIVDGTGRYMLPGLWEGHTHLRARPDEAPADQVARLEAILASYLAVGITTVLELGGPLDIDGRLREKHRITPATDSADLYFAGPSFTGINGWPLEMHNNRALIREAGDAESARRMVLELEGETDFVKCIYDGEPGAPDKLPRAALKAIVVASHDRGKSVLAHIATKRDIEECVDAGVDCIEHTFIPEDPSDFTEAADVAQLLAGTGTFFSPTLAIFEQIGRSGDRTYLHELARDAIVSSEEAHAAAERPSFGAPFPHHPAKETLARFRYGMRSLPIMRDAGVKIVAGSDVGMFMSRPAALLRELQLLSKAGLSGSAVVTAATRYAAEKIGKGGSVGTIAAGLVADALLLDADPSADVMHLVRPRHRIATIRRGSYSPAAIP